MPQIPIEAMMPRHFQKPVDTTVQHHPVFFPSLKRFHQLHHVGQQPAILKIPVNNQFLFPHRIPLLPSIFSPNQSVTNSTRFIVVTNRKIFLKDAGKVSICFELPHESGSLYHMLSHFIYNNLNMNKIESRPIEDRNWEYRFFIDFDGNLADGAVKNALRGLREEARNMRILVGNHNKTGGIGNGLVDALFQYFQPICFRRVDAGYRCLRLILILRHFPCCKRIVIHANLFP